MTQKGCLIVLDGIDGTGKTELATKLAQHFFIYHKEFTNVLLTKEPTNSEYGKKIRYFLTQQMPKKDEIFFELFVKDREEHIRTLVKPALEENSIIFCDRYAYSTLAYQSAQGISKKLLEEYTFFKPDLTILLDVDVETALERIQKARKNKDSFEQKTFLEAVRKNFLDLPKKFKDHQFVLIDASKSRRDVLSDSIKAIEEFLDAKTKR